MAFPPRGFIIGAQKAGTTSLADMLADQPGITLSEPKEPRYFSENLERGLDWYRARFNGPEESLFLDASPAYTAAPTATFSAEMRKNDPRIGIPQRIQALSPDARFIYLLRDPVDRVYSAYWHDVRAGHQKDGFREAVQRWPIYLRTSDYAGQIENYLAYFPLQRFLLIDFHQLIREPEVVVRACCAFLEVEFGGFACSSRERQKNKGYQLSGPASLLRRVLGSQDNFSRVARRVRAALPRPVVAQITRWMTNDIPPMSPADREYVADLLCERTRALHELTGFDVSTWRPQAS